MHSEKGKDKRQAGEILMFVIFIIIFLMLFVSLFLSRTLARQSKATNNVVSTLQAYYLADTGAEYSLYRFRNVCDSGNQPPLCITNNQPTFVPDGICDITYDSSTSKISITGTYRGQTSRAIELTWTQL
jgi:hypothetical protein